MILCEKKKNGVDDQREKRGRKGRNRCVFVSKHKMRKKEEKRRRKKKKNSKEFKKEIQK